MPKPTQKKEWIGARKVTGMQVLDIKTPGGQEVVKVVYDDGFSNEMTKKRYDIVLTDVKGDATTVQKLVRDATGSLFYSLLIEYGVLHGEVDGIMEDVARRVDAATDKVTNLLYGVDHPANRELFKVNQILLEKYETEHGNDGAAPAGSGSDKKDSN